jgi:monoamine oxidase
MPNVLEAILAGKKMAEFELFDDKKVIDGCIWLLEKFLGKSIPQPIAMKRTKWLTNPNFYGTYSYQSHLAGMNNVLPTDLAKSIVNAEKKPLILFAGEATDDKFPSNAHGAITSGWRVADEIITYHS